MPKQAYESSISAGMTMWVERRDDDVGGVRDCTVPYNLYRRGVIINVKEALPSSSCFNTRNTIGLSCSTSLYPARNYFLYPVLSQRQLGSKAHTSRLKGLFGFQSRAGEVCTG